MTPAILVLQKHKVRHTVHEYKHDTRISSYGLEAAEKMAVSAQQVFKTLVVTMADGGFAVGLVPVDQSLSLKAMSRVLGNKKVEMAKPEQVQRVTGYVLGGVSPLGQKKRLATVIDEAAQNFSTVFVSAGRRGLEIELSPLDLAALVGAQFGPIKQS